MKVSINGYEWEVVYTSKSKDLMRSDGSLTFGVTDRNLMCMFLSASLKGDLLRKVLLHELTHAFIFSYGYYLTVEEEEFVCSFMDCYAYDLVSLTNNLLYIGIGIKYV